MPPATLLAMDDLFLGLWIKTIRLRGGKKSEMTWAYGAFWPISMYKRGSDILKMRGGQNKTMFAGYFWGAQQLFFFFLPLKSKPSAADNWLLFFFLFWKRETTSGECQIFASHCSSSPATMWNVNERMQAEETFGGEGAERFSLWTCGPAHWIALWHWEIGNFDWLNLLRCSLLHFFFPSWSSYTNLKKRRRKKKERLQTRRWSPVNFSFFFSQRIQSL